MISRDSRVQLVAIGLALLLLVGFAWLAPENPPPWLVALILGAYYGVAFGGAHLYLTFRGDGESVPLSARVRFLVALGVMIPLFAGAQMLYATRLWGVDVPLALRVTAVAVFVVYFLNEARLSYREVHRPTESG